MTKQQTVSAEIFSVALQRAAETILTPGDRLPIVAVSLGNFRQATGHVRCEAGRVYIEVEQDANLEPPIMVSVAGGAPFRVVEDSTGE